MSRKFNLLVVVSVLILALLFTVSCKKNAVVEDVVKASTTLNIENVEMDVEKTADGYKYTAVVHLKTSAEGSGVNLTGVSFTISLYRDGQLMGSFTFGAEAFDATHAPPSSTFDTKPLIILDTQSGRQADRVGLTADYDGVSGKLSVSSDLTLPEEKIPPAIDYFRVGSDNLEYGSSTTLSWKVSHATEINLYHNGVLSHPNVAPEDQIEISPGNSGSHQYQLKATNSDGNAERNVTITVEKEPVVPGGPTVYVTDTGKKYHTSTCGYLDQSKRAISLTQAKIEGYTPCKVCKPPK